MIFHPNLHALYTFLHQSLSLSTEDKQYLKQITQPCSICQHTNPNSNVRPPPFPTHQDRGCLTAMDWQMDFNHMPPIKKIKYLLVLVDTFTGWVEAFPTTTKRASTVATILVTDIIPQFGLPDSRQWARVCFLYFSKAGTSLKHPLEISHPLSPPTLRQGRVCQSHTQKYSHQTLSRTPSRLDKSPALSLSPPPDSPKETTYAQPL
jgi:hypothetical protein